MTNCEICKHNGTNPNLCEDCLYFNTESMKCHFEKRPETKNQKGAKQ